MGRRGCRSVAAVTELTSVDVDGIDLTYRTAGEAGLPVVLLLHALGEDSSDWNAVVEALAPANRVYALDLRGHGGSSQPGTSTSVAISGPMLPPGKAVDKRSAEGLETLDTFRCNVFASTVRAMRRSLDATEDQLARASRIGRQRLETIETGGTTTRADMSQV